MIHYKNFILSTCLAMASLTLTAQDCQRIETEDVKKEIANIPGETMGQKLESLLFWTQEEKERRFPIMQSIYPSLPVAAGTEVYPLLKAEEINPKWESDTDLASYIEDNRVGGVVVLKDGEI